jgi:hypothetical protein
MVNPEAEQVKNENKNLNSILQEKNQKIEELQNKLILLSTDNELQRQARLSQSITASNKIDKALYE